MPLSACCSVRTAQTILRLNTTLRLNEGPSGPMAMRGVAELAKSYFPESGDLALQITEMPFVSGEDSGEDSVGGLSA